MFLFTIFADQKCIATW